MSRGEDPDAVVSVMTVGFAGIGRMGLPMARKRARKDTALAQDLAAEPVVRTPATDAAAAMLEEAVEKGLADADMAAVVGLLGRTATGARPTSNDDLTEEP